MSHIPKEPEYTTEIEFVEQNILFLTKMHSQGLESVRQIELILKDLNDDLKNIKTIELKPMIQRVIDQKTTIKKQSLEIIKRSRKDLGFWNLIYKIVKRNEHVK